MSKKTVILILALLAVAVLAGRFVTRADEVKKEDLKRWENEFMSVVKKGRELWTSPDLGTNGVSCAQCHPNAANSHPETYPKFQQQLGKVAALRDMINFCIMNPLEGKKLALDDPKMIALEAYAAYERRGVAMAPGKH